MTSSTDPITIQNLVSFDPFAGFEDDELGDPFRNHIDIRIQQRSGKKFITTVEGLSPKLDFKRLIRTLKKEFNCNGSVVQHPVLGEIIQLQGDQRKQVADFLVREGLYTKDCVLQHGY